MTGPVFLAARVAGRIDLGGGYHVLCLEAPAVARAAAAGQFVLLSVRPRDLPGLDPLLPRPFSFLGRDAAGGTVELFFRVVGRGTARLAALQVGARLDLLGPLGRGWPTPTASRALLVAGGVGLPPILDLAAELSRAGTPVEVLYGGRSRTDIHLLDRFEAAGVPVTVTTEDGSCGSAGRVTEPLRARLESAGDDALCLYACGPTGMLKAVAEAGRAHGVSTSLSLEAPMACGVGVCRGCAVPAAGGGYRMVCTEGPVFAAEEVAL